MFCERKLFAPSTILSKETVLLLGAGRISRFAKGVLFADVTDAEHPKKRHRDFGSSDEQTQRSSPHTHKKRPAERIGGALLAFFEACVCPFTKTCEKDRQTAASAFSSFYFFILLYPNLIFLFSFHIVPFPLLRQIRFALTIKADFGIFIFFFRAVCAACGWERRAGDGAARCSPARQVWRNGWQRGNST